MSGEWSELGSEYDPEYEEEKSVPAWEVEPTESWNYSIVLDEEDPSRSLTFEKSGEMPEYPWSSDAVPVQLFGKGKRLPFWQEYQNSAGPLPHSPVDSDAEEDEIELIPYGATTLRIASLPVTPA